MKYRFALLALMAASAAPLAAQGGGGGGAGGGAAGGGRGQGRGGGPAPMTYDQLNTILGFTADQKPRVETAIKQRDDIITPIQTWQNAAMQAARAGGGQFTPNADSTKKRTDAIAAFNTTLKAILTPAQGTKFDSVLANPARGGGRGGRGGGGGGGGGGGF